MKIFSIICVLLVAVSIGQAQILTIRDAVTREPLEQVALFSLHPGVSAVTDAKGRVNLAPFATADSVRVEMIGYERLILSYRQLFATLPTLLLNQQPFALDEVVVSAIRWKQPRNEVPARMITLSRSELPLQNPQTAADMLGNSGQVFIQKSQLGGGSPMIRGFATNRILLVVDGVRMNSAIFRRGNVQNVISIDPLSVENAEVVFGPGSILYGSDALGGVISFNTIAPGLSHGDEHLFSTDIFTRYSSVNQEKTGHVGLHFGLRKWAFATSVTFSDFGDVSMGSNGPEAYLRPHYVETIGYRDSMLTNPDPQKQVPSGYSQLSLMQKIRFLPNDALDLNYGLRYSTTSDYSRYDRLLRYKNNTLRSAEWYYGPQEWMLQTFNVLLQSENSLFDRMNITAAWQRFEESRHDRDFNGTLRRHRTETVNALSLNADFERNLSQAGKLYYGIETVYDLVSSVGVDENTENGSSLPGPTRYPDGTEWQSWALYANYRHKFTEDVILQAGLRYSRVFMDGIADTTFYKFPFTDFHVNNGALNGSLGAVYNPGGGWQLNANLSTGFRAPNVDDVAKVFDPTPGFVVVPNPDLTPEYAYNAELSITKLIDNLAKANLTAFYTYLDKAMVRRNFTFNGRDSLEFSGELSQVQAIQNAAFVEVIGVQADVELHLPFGFALLSALTIQKGTEELDNGSTAALRHQPPTFGSTHLTWKRGALEADFYAVYNGELSYDDMAPEEQDKNYLYAPDELGRPYSPSWMTLNLKGRYRFSDMFAFTLGIENIADIRYRPYSSGISAPGRNFIAALAVKL